MRLRLRILPMLIFVAAMMLTLKIGNIWHGLSPGGGRMSVQLAYAAEAEKASLAQAGGPQNAPNAASDPTRDGSGGSARAGGERPTLGGRDTAATSGGQLIDPQQLSQSEMRLLQSLAERRQVLDRLEESLNWRESLLKAAEQQLVDRQSRFLAMHRKLMSLLNQLDEKEERRIGNLVKIYENMKPKDAAKIFNELEMPVLLGVVERMKVRKVAPVIAAMKADKAREVTRALAQRQKTAMATTGAASPGNDSRK